MAKAGDIELGDLGEHAAEQVPTPTQLLPQNDGNHDDMASRLIFSEKPLPKAISYFLIRLAINLLLNGLGGYVSFASFEFFAINMAGTEALSYCFGGIIMLQSSCLLSALTILCTVIHYQRKKAFESHKFELIFNFYTALVGSIAVCGNLLSLLISFKVYANIRWKNDPKFGHMIVVASCIASVIYGIDSSLPSGKILSSSMICMAVDACIGIMMLILNVGFEAWISALELVLYFLGFFIAAFGLTCLYHRKDVKKWLQRVKIQCIEAFNNA